MLPSNHNIDSLRELLDSEAARFNTPEFIPHDPVQFPRRFSALPDIEIVALLSATIAWGNRKMICNNCEKMLSIMGHEPRQYVMSQDYEQLPDEQNIHRTFFARNFKYMLRGLHNIYHKYSTLNDFATAHHVGDSEEPSWRLTELLQHELASANSGHSDSRCLPTNLRNTALKRINMALRWLVRDDGIVDLGVWDAIKPSQLFIPLDVHVADTARGMGFTTRRANDKKTVLEVTNLLRQLRPDDPVVYDFALFGLGIKGA